MALERPVPVLALLVEFDRILTGEAQHDDPQYHDLVLNAIRGTLLARDQQRGRNHRLREALEHLRCFACGQRFRESSDECHTHLAVRLVLDEVRYTDPRLAPLN